MNVYFTILISILGGGIPAIEFLNGVALFFSLTIIGVICIVLSAPGYFHHKINFIRQVESMSVQAKIEDILGLADGKVYPLTGYWHGESIVPTEYVHTRKNAVNSTAFVRALTNHKDTLLTKIAFLCFGLICLSLLVLAIFL